MAVPCSCCPPALVRCTSSGQRVYGMLCDCDPNDGFQTVQPTSFTNGSFEQPAIGNGTFANQPNAAVPGWDQIPGTYVEIWNSPFGGVPGLVPYPGTSDQLCELQGAGGTNTIVQVVTVPAAAGTVHWGFWHHRRAGTDEVTTLTLGDNATPPAGHTVVATAQPGASNAWLQYSGAWGKPAGLTAVRMALTGTSSVSGSGNLVDEVTFTFTAGCVAGTKTYRWFDSSGIPVDPALIINCP